MASLPVPQITSSRRCAGVLTRAAYHYAKSRGVAADALLRQARLDLDVIADSAITVGVSNQIKFVELVAEALHDELFGFHLVDDFDFREIGLLYYVTASADTLGTAMRRAERYVGLQNDGVRFKVSKGKTLRVRFQYAGVARHTDIHQIEALITLVVRVLRHLTGRSLTPTRIHMMHPVPGHKAELERLLDATIETGAEVDEIEFPAESFDYPIVSADPFLHRLCVQTCEEALARQNKNLSPLKVQVENAIAALLPHGQARHDLVAARLGMSPRTLARRLSSAGQSFAGILNEIRAALAERYLADPALSISQIAWLLGYTEIGTFTRAFQRWTGATPSAARLQRQSAAKRDGVKRQISGSK